MLVGRIQTRDPSKVKVVVRQPKHLILLVYWLGKWVLLTWDPRHKRIGTFLPLSASFSEDGQSLYGREDPPEWEEEIRAYRERKQSEG